MPTRALAALEIVRAGAFGTTRVRVAAVGRGAGHDGEALAQTVFLPMEPV